MLRLFLYPFNRFARIIASGKWVKDKIAKTDQRIPLMPGEYQVKGWKQLGDFDPVSFEMAVSEDKEITLKAKGK